MRSNGVFHHPDVVVVGAGPAGVAAATVLARAGKRVALIDKARFPRDKCCGDGLTTGALRRLESLGLRCEELPSWASVGEVWVRSPSGRSAGFPLPAGTGVYGAVVPRFDLDAALVGLARKAGAEVLEDHALRSARSLGSEIEVELEGYEPMRAPYVIGADGMWSRLRKALCTSSVAGYLGEWHAFRQYFSDVGPLASGRMWVWLEEDLLPGYAWSFSLPDGRANIGFGIRRAPGRPTGEMRVIWPDLISRSHVRAVLGSSARPESTHKAWPIPAQSEQGLLVACGGRALFAGDAARVADPLTGEGIGQALETGRLAAEAILRAGPTEPLRAGLGYCAAVRRGLGVDNHLAAGLSRLLGRSWGAREAVRLASRVRWTRNNFGRWLMEDYPRAILVTPHRWSGGMLAGKGAFDVG